MKMLSQRAAYLLGFIITVALLSMTFYLQKFDGFVPCPLCILQRLALACLGVMLLLGWMAGNRKISSLLIGILASLFSLIGILLAGRQVWLQHLPPDKNADCGVSLEYLINALPFDQVVSRVLRGSAECSQKGWEFLQLSMAEWSLICFIAFFLFCLLQMCRTMRRC